MLTKLTARRLLTGTEEIDYPSITMEDGRIVDLRRGRVNDSTETLTAAFFDIHVHGACSYDFMTATPAEVAIVGRFLAGRGVAHYLATTVTGPVDVTLRALEMLADAIEESHGSGPGAPIAAPVGIHLEGPFLSPVKRGVHPALLLQEPSVELFTRFQHAARGHIRLLTIAPELSNALNVIEHAVASGVRVSLGHSNGSAAETLAAIAAGAVSATHLGNAMRTLEPREPGIMGIVLDRGDMYAEAICDGVHLDPAFVRLWLKLKGEERAILVTDGMSATGMPDGTYALGELSVEVKGGVCLAGSALAGSVLTMDQAVANLRRFTGSSLATAVRLASRNPARMLGMERLTEMTPGFFANFNVFDDAGERVGSVFNGLRI
jgi:N-acetylglucosamine-6-phosphate deacetylase